MLKYSTPLDRGMGHSTVKGLEKTSNSGHDTGRNTNTKATEGVRTLLGDPKKAIITLSLPMILAMSTQTLYNLVDAIWVSGLGADALAAVGFFFPFFFLIMAFATGIGVGGGSAISRRIGAKDKAGADNVAVHTIVLMMALALGLSIPFYAYAPAIFGAIGAGRTLSMAVNYARVMFAFAGVIIFGQIALAILRAEGDTKRAMYAMVLGSGLNIVLDPVFIYALGFGVRGAAIATVISMSVSALLLFYWLFMERSTYVSFEFRDFHPSMPILKDILRVGLPSTIQQMAMSFMMLMMNVFIVRIGNTDGVAVFSTGWRVVMIGTLPLLGMATAVVSVSGAAFGARDIGKLDTTHRYAVKLGLIIESAVALVTFIFAPQIAAVFTQGQGGERILGELVTFLRIVCFFYPGVSLGMLSSAMFQGIGKGTYSLWVTVFRTIVLAPPAALFFALFLGMGLSGIWWGIVAGNLTGSATAFIWARYHINALKVNFNGMGARGGGK